MWLGCCANSSEWHGWPVATIVRVRLPLAFAASMLVVGSMAALAQTAGDVAEDVEFRGYHAAAGVDISVGDLEDLASSSSEIGFVALVDTPSGGADRFADDILAVVSSRNTVIVLTASEAGISSRVYDDAELDAAFDAALGSVGDSYETDFRQLVDALGVSSSATGSGGFGVGWILVILVIAGGVFLVFRSSREDSQFKQKRLSSARKEISDQMAVIANEILAFSDRVDVADHPEAVAHYRRASETYSATETRLQLAETWTDLAALSDDLDTARWEMAAAQALVDGREVPDRPDAEPPEPCFFDPTHGAGVEVAELRTPAGGRNVMVCAEDAAKLRRGEKPEPRTITVGGRQVPSAQAPRSHGGRGFDWLDAFSIILGGMSDGVGYRWRRPMTRRARGGFPFPGGFGGPVGGGRSRRTTGSASRPRSGRTGRARRSR